MTRRTTCGLIITVACAIVASAQTSTQFASLATRSATSSPRSFSASEPHIQSETVGAFYVNSAFAHGYRHGYEQGFHAGDLDLHMGRDARVAMKLNGQAGREYNLSFGSKLLFQDGYEAGLRSGYADAISGNDFRATQRAMTATAGLTEILPNTRRAHFDEGFAAGYKSAQSQSAPVAQ